LIPKFASEVPQGFANFGIGTLENVMPIIESPCSKVCTLDPKSGLCLGCGRTLTEIERWSDLSASERAHLISVLPARLAALRGVQAISPDAA
jgi:predicted Fe-S protein YdhL (DUF1289 family)